MHCLFFLFSCAISLKISTFFFSNSINSLSFSSLLINNFSTSLLIFPKLSITTSLKLNFCFLRSGSAVLGELDGEYTNNGDEGEETGSSGDGIVPLYCGASEEIETLDK